MFTYCPLEHYNQTHRQDPLWRRLLEVCWCLAQSSVTAYEKKYWWNSRVLLTALTWKGGCCSHERLIFTKIWWFIHHHFVSLWLLTCNCRPPQTSAAPQYIWLSWDTSVHEATPVYLKERTHRHYNRKFYQNHFICLEIFTLDLSSRAFAWGKATAHQFRFYQSLCMVFNTFSSPGMRCYWRM